MPKATSRLSPRTVRPPATPTIQMATGSPAKDSTGETIYLGHTEIRRATATGALTATRYYTFNGQQIATRTGSTALSWQAVDSHGTTELSIEASSGTLNRLRTDPFGNPRKTTPCTSSKGFIGG